MTLKVRDLESKNLLRFGDWIFCFDKKRPVGANTYVFFHGKEIKDLFSFDLSMEANKPIIVGLKFYVLPEMI